MASRNGYFTFDVRNDGTYVTIIPSNGGGKEVSVEDIATFLDAKRFENYNMADIKKGLDASKNTPTFKISTTAMKSSAAFCIYEVSRDNMFVAATMMPAVMGGSKMTEKEIIGDLQAKGVKFGYDEAVIGELIKMEAYNTKVIVAKGQPVTPGSDGKIQYMFDTKPVPKPKVDENGSVDYHELNLINKVTAGQTVAVIIPAVAGISGHNVLGAELIPNKVSKVSFKYNKNLHVSDDGLELIADVNGHISLEGDKVFVSNTYEVPVDVDVTTGDINYDGNVLIRGNVRAGFSVKATGDVTVLGVVEGARVEAGGNLTISRGVQGMNKAVLIAGGNAVAKFLENATINCEGNLDTDTLLHSNVTAGGYIEANGKNGLIIGGIIRSGKNISAKQIGNEMGTSTDISIGVDPNVKNRLNELTAIIKKTNEDKTKMNQVVTLLKKKLEVEGKLEPAKMEMLQKSLKGMIVLDTELKSATEEYRDLQSRLTEDGDARVKVSRSIYPGVKLTFGSTSMFIKDRNDYCQYVKRGADIARLPL